MKKIHCLNPIAACGTDLFPADYEMTDNKAEADAFLVRSAPCMKWSCLRDFWQ